MNERERFVAAMHYQPRDRSPIWDFSFWEDTLPVWHEQGLPKHIDRFNSEEYLGMDSGPETCARLVGVEFPRARDPQLNQGRSQRRNEGHEQSSSRVPLAFLLTPSE